MNPLLTPNKDSGKLSQFWIISLNCCSLIALCGHRVKCSFIFTIIRSLRHHKITKVSLRLNLNFNQYWVSLICIFIHLRVNPPVYKLINARKLSIANKVSQLPESTVWPLSRQESSRHHFFRLYLSYSDNCIAYLSSNLSDKEVYGILSI